MKKANAAGPKKAMNAMKKANAAGPKKAMKTMKKAKASPKKAMQTMKKPAASSKGKLGVPEEHVRCALCSGSRVRAALCVVLRV